MRSYFNIFLTLVIPLSLFSTSVATVYYALDLDLTKAIKVAIVYGVLIGVSLALILALFIFINRYIQIKRFQKKIPQDSNQYAHFHNIQAPIEQSPVLQKIDSKEFMLLINKELTFEVSVIAIIQEKIGEIITQDKNKGYISLHNTNEEIEIYISTLTKHTTRIQITTDNPKDSKIQNIIDALKAKEHSFMQY